MDAMTGNSGQLDAISSTLSNDSCNRITTKNARSRNFLVDTIGHQDSLLGTDELFHHLPSGKVSVFILTWNMSGKQAPSQLNDALLPENMEYIPDIYAIGTQETPGYGSLGDIKAFQILLQTTIGPSHVLLHSASLGVLHLSIFLRRDLIWFVSIPENDSYNNRSKATNIVKTKGAICISFSLFGTTLLFVNCHLSAHQDKNQARMNEYDQICRTLDLPRNLKPLRPVYVSNDVTARFDCVFWFGDLNFRIEKKYSEALKMLTRSSMHSFNALLNDDQLSNAIKKGEIFYGFQESLITFAPTYKYRIGTDNFDILSQRVPSYTDRILYRNKKKDQIDCLIYDTVQSVKTSDHKPVYALIKIKIKAGRDDIPLNAGKFRRDVYVDAIRKRVEQRYKSISSTVCSVS